MEDTGLVRKYYNDYLEEEYFQINGKKHGLYTLYDHKGYIIRTMEFVEGVKHGQYISYHNLSNVIDFKANYSNGLKVGESYLYSEDGKITVMSKYENDQLVFRVNYNNDGSVKREANYNNYVRNGETIEYFKFESDIIKNIYNYVDDKIISVSQYKNDELVFIIDYYDNGFYKEKCHYTNNIRNGECIEYNKDGTVNCIYNYVDGKIVNH
jgi:antitoxin component YwqK of YwqJK toxin-antitoxin module